MRERIAKMIMEVHLRIFDVQTDGNDRNGFDSEESESKKTTKTKDHNFHAKTRLQTAGKMLLQSLEMLLKFPDYKVEQLTEGTLLIVSKSLESILNGEIKYKHTTRALHNLWNSPESDHSHGLTFIGRGRKRHYFHYHWKDSNESKDDDGVTKKEEGGDADADLAARLAIRFQEERHFVIRSLRAAIAHKRLVHGRTLKDIQSLFEAADLNGDGALDCDEISGLMKHLDIPFSTSQAENDFAHVLTNGGTHALLLEEFVSAITEHHHSSTASLIHRHQGGGDVLHDSGEARST
eukprot:g3197.t1